MATQAMHNPAGSGVIHVGPELVDYYSRQGYTLVEPDPEPEATDADVMAAVAALLAGDEVAAVEGSEGVELHTLSDPIVDVEPEPVVLGQVILGDHGPELIPTDNPQTTPSDTPAPNQEN